ncbi:hypothetical protein IFM89_039016 [Coptis chinensis]|uniref:Uncharacterized protein n=1 Tax=Coptis chinensis TaxID=261450 RepID=A0A835IIJ8_9MAGN|nr:hypothetical protein IFM89_039016 [Coptis chinensis]
MSSCGVGPQFPEWLQTQKHLTTLIMLNASISDSIPSWFQNLSSTLSYIDLSSNQIHGEVPNFIKSDPDGMRLYLSSNRVEGSIGELSSLETLRLSNNFFHGQLSSALQYCTCLSILDLSENSLSGKIPTWIGGELSSLKILRLRSNMLNGSIPPDIMDLARNHLSGIIPQCIGNFSGMLVGQTEVFKEEKEFRGYTDKLNQKIGQMKTLLESLDFSINTLSGPIPSGNQLQTFEDKSIYLGNLELCGPPLEKACLGDQLPPAPTYIDSAVDHGDEFKISRFYISMASGFVRGGVLGNTWCLALQEELVGSITLPSIAFTFTSFVYNTLPSCVKLCKL